MPCAVAHYIAAELNVPPLEVGKTADETGVRITMCQLGLFGYARKGSPAYRVRTPMENVPEELAQAIQAATTNGRVPCAALWTLADECGLSRQEVANAVEGLGIKVKPCQLGCF